MGQCIASAVGWSRTLCSVFRITTLVMLLVVSCVETQAADGSATLGALLDRQDAWLSSSPEGEAWNKFLHTDQLRAELAKHPSQVDKRTVAKVLARYESGTAGLEHPNFAPTKTALAHWANDHRVAMAVRWSEEARSQARHLKEFDEQSVEAARRELVDATGALNSMLATADQTTHDGWKKFLKWESLDESLLMGTPNWTSLQEVGGQFFNGHPGLEYPEFVRVRNALRKYIYMGHQSSQESLAAQMNQLATVIDAYNKEPTTEHASDVASMLDWLDQLGIVPTLAPQIRAAHSLPNIKLRVSESLLQRRFSQPVDEPMAVNEMILGTHVRGTAITRGLITADVVANPNVAQIDIVFRGNAQTRSVGRQKPVTIQSTSATGLEARKPLFIYPRKIASAGAKATASTNTKIHSITPDRRIGRRLVEKIAWKRANQQTPQTQGIASARSARRLEKQIDEQTQSLLTRAQASLRGQLNGPINRRGLLPEDLRTLSLDSCAIVFAQQANSGQFAASSRPPEFCPHDDVVAQVHESAFNNTAEKAIAGLTITDKRVAELTKEITGEVPKELEITEDSQPWSLSFAWTQPVTIALDDEKLTIAIRARRLTDGDTTLDFSRGGHMEIKATYSMVVNPSGIQLTRQGDVEVSLAGKKRLGLKERAFKAIMKKKFEEVFKQAIQGEGFKLPGQFADIGTIRLKDLSADNGWLSVGWSGANQPF